MLYKVYNVQTYMFFKLVGLGMYTYSYAVQSVQCTDIHVFKLVVLGMHILVYCTIYTDIHVFNVV